MKPDKHQPPELEYFPKVGPIMWMLMFTLLLPSLGVALVGSHFVEISNRNIWVLLLAAPVPIILVSFPRSYVVDQLELRINGWFYRLRIDRGTIVSLEPIGFLKALLHPGSLFCSNPSTALKINRSKGCTLIISPRDPEVFMRLFTKQPDSRKE